MPIIPALSVRQPYASAILTGQKAEEFRSWPTSHRGLIAVHAARTVEHAAFGEYPNFAAGRCEVGCVLGIVEVVGCEPDVYGGFAWLLANPRWLRRPVPCKGRLGLWKFELPDDLWPVS